MKDGYFRRNAWHRLVNPAGMNYFVIKECIKYVFKCSGVFWKRNNDQTRVLSDETTVQKIVLRSVMIYWENPRNTNQIRNMFTVGKELKSF